MKTLSLAATILIALSFAGLTSCVAMNQECTTCCAKKGQPAAACCDTKAKSGAPGSQAGSAHQHAEPKKP